MVAWAILIKPAELPVRLSRQRRSAGAWWLRRGPPVEAASENDCKPEEVFPSVATAGKSAVLAKQEKKRADGEEGDRERLARYPSHPANRPWNRLPNRRSQGQAWRARLLRGTE